LLSVWLAVTWPVMVDHAGSWSVVLGRGAGSTYCLLENIRVCWKIFGVAVAVCQK